MSTSLLDKNEYPTQKCLKIIRNWDILKDGIDNLLNFLQEIWWIPDWGFKLTGKKVKKLELHTGGWSGNEDVICALRDNFLFWSLYWTKSIHGGHFYFTIRPIKKASARHNVQKQEIK